MCPVVLPITGIIAIQAEQQPQSFLPQEEVYLSTCRSYEDVQNIDNVTM